eukprot:Blabericola_migrator_1__6241@NODE_314_length_10020_cov_127_741485_g257_i0_p10_GENE_NODE_314_length_10020_cov_127_741485_g257_i0NODE_314_length_10020_cov_127_741485_g257_i0_p10_ORF_typecomplete_len168_score32_64PMSR/PF01625_21/2_3e60HMA/PF00403_26/15HMA/PF00403_26/35HMA/PF00403_26/1_1e03ORF45/PF17620_2/0_18_NODE_314_length_10020_cov_127_741485_g257_i038214324
MTDIYLGGGCFWCVEAALRGLNGVRSAVSGYCGGTTDNPTYEEVCEGNTGHAETVKVTYDPKNVELRDVMKRFLKVHDPSQLNRQGDDVGTQYRSVIFYSHEDQVPVIKAALSEWEEDYGRPTVTEILPVPRFWPAEDYHQRYYEKNGASNAYCQRVVKKKLAKIGE